MDTIFQNQADVSRKWYLVDASGKTLGRLASRVAMILRGKNKSNYDPSKEMGDFVVIVNAEKIAVTGKKATDKMYYKHSGYVGGLKSWNFEEKIARHPTEPLERAIKGMLPHNRLGRELFKNVKIYAGSEHPHAGQHPQPLAID